MTNPSFESGLTGWSVAAGSSGTAASVVPDSRDYPLMPDGTHAAQVTATDDGTTTLQQTVGTAAAGSTYVLELYETSATTGDSMNYTVEILAGTTVIGTSDDPDYGSQTANGQWFGVQVTGTVAPGSSLAGQALKIELIADGQGGDGGVLFDDVRLSQWQTSPPSTPSTTPTMPQFGFQGMRWDAAVGLYDDNARYYDPAVGTFLSQDPGQQGPNPYQFDGNDPVDNTDPSGEFYNRWQAIAGGLGVSPPQEIAPIANNIGSSYDSGPSDNGEGFIGGDGGGDFGDNGATSFGSTYLAGMRQIESMGNSSPLVGSPTLTDTQDPYLSTNTSVQLVSNVGPVIQQLNNEIYSEQSGPGSNLMAIPLSSMGLTSGAQTDLNTLTANPALLQYAYTVGSAQAFLDGNATSPLPTGIQLLQHNLELAEDYDPDDADYTPSALEARVVGSAQLAGTLASSPALISSGLGIAALTDFAATNIQTIYTGQYQQTYAQTLTTSALQAGGFSPTDAALVGTVVGFGEALPLAPESQGSFQITPSFVNIPETFFNQFPDGVPRPTGPINLLDGNAYIAARQAANQENRTLSTGFGLGPANYEIHEIVPVKFGGSPTALSNKVALVDTIHAQATTFFNRLQRILQGR